VYNTKRLIMNFRKIFLKIILLGTRHYFFEPFLMCQSGFVMNASFKD
jgi:hypothetical protein